MKKTSKLGLILLTFLLFQRLESQELYVTAGGSLYISPSSNMHVNDNLNINETGTLTISSNVTNSGSLIVKGIITGKISYQRYVPSANWHFVAAPVMTQNIATFTLNATNAIDTKGNLYGISMYNNTNARGSRWEYYNNSATGQPLSLADASNFISGKGYSIKRNIAGTYTFTGNMASSDLEIVIPTNTSHKWTLIGNPYPSFLPVNIAANALNILATNIANLDPNFAYLNFWNGTEYQVVNLADVSALYLAPGQAFMVNPSVNNSTFTFLENQQTAQIATEATFYKTAVTPEITISLYNGSLTKTTRLKYFENTTTGLDVGYDAGTYTDGTPTFALDTHLVTDSKGINFTLQCLPNSNYESSIVPLSVVASANESLTFSANAINLPIGLNLFLEDKETNTITNISNSTYQVTTKTALNGIGRFYFHTSAKVLSAEDSYFTTLINIYKTSNTNVRITGLQQQGIAVVKLYSLEGKEIMMHAFKMEIVNNIELPKNLARGVYLIQLVANDKKQTKKLIIE